MSYEFHGYRTKRVQKNIRCTYIGPFEIQNSTWWHGHGESMHGDGGSYNLGRASCTTCSRIGW
jgi:hypothetical protein